ncbi:MAG: M20 family metallopeptidase [Bacillota bacterium]|nr:M20 family metallopeptidase [Bacillota bacterium]
MNIKVMSVINEIKAELKELSDYIYKNPELGNKEYLAAGAHTALLEKYGFKVEKSYLGIETAFKAVYDTGIGDKTAAFLAEYDALPEIGHGCGHNLLGAVSTGAGIALSKIIKSGKVIVFGTPAEETNGAKVDMAKADVFKDVDAVFEAHPADHNAASMKSLAMEALEFSFIGRTAHAAACPEKGINALEAAINMFNNLNGLREHIPQSARIHGIIREGGRAANIVPDLAVNEFYVRGESKKQVEELVEKVKNCAYGASLAAGTELKIRNYEKSNDDFISNFNLMHRYMKYMNDAGVESIKEMETTCGSADAGNVSYVVPALHAWFAITKVPVASHTIEFARETLTDYAEDQMVKAVYGLVMTANDMINDAEFNKSVKEEYKKNIRRI